MSNRFSAIWGIILLSLFFSCKKDEGLTDEQKEYFIKFYGVNAEGRDMAQTSDGGFIMLGTIYSPPSQDFYLVKTDAFGNTMWSRRIDGPRDVDEASALVVTSDQKYALAGSYIDTILDTATNIEHPINRAQIFITNSSGIVMSSRKLGDPMDINEYGNDLIITANGNYMVACEQQDPANGNLFGSGYEISAADMSIVTEISCKLLIDTITKEYYNVAFKKVIQRISGRYVFTGSSNQPKGTQVGENIILAEYDISVPGEPTEYATFGLAGDDVGFDVAELADGSLVTVGYVSPETGSNDIAIFKVEDVSSNDPTWIETVGGNRSDEAFSLYVLSDGFLLGGFTESEGSDRQMCLIRTDAVGKVMWKKTFGYGGLDEARSVIQTADGGIALFGTSTDERGNTAMCLIKLDKNGELK